MPLHWPAAGYVRAQELKSMREQKTWSNTHVVLAGEDHYVNNAATEAFFQQNSAEEHQPKITKLDGAYHSVTIEVDTHLAQLHATMREMFNQAVESFNHSLI